LCCNNCQLRPSNYTCRAATSSCDIPEVCDGKSGDCPEDKHVDDLTDCGNGRQCASGQCTSKDDQCTARGVTIKSTKACSGVQYSNLGCQVACLYPNSNQCYVFSGYYVDGTSCGVGGVCNAGNCDTKNFGNNVKSWIDNHKQIVIPVAIVVGLLLLFCIFRCCCYGGSRGYSNIGSTYVVTSAAAPPQYNGQYNTQPYYPPPPANGQQYYTPPPNNPSGWVDPVAYNGSGPNRGLQTPPPVYSNASGPQPPTHDSYELNNAQSWQNSGPNSPRPQSPHNNVNLPQQMPVPPPHNSNARPYNEGVV
jgi:hypothetical protein